MYFGPTWLVPEFLCSIFHLKRLLINFSFGSLKQACFGSTADLEFYPGVLPTIEFLFCMLGPSGQFHCQHLTGSLVLVGCHPPWYTKG